MTELRNLSVAAAALIALAACAPETNTSGGASASSGATSTASAGQPRLAIAPSLESAAMPAPAKMADDVAPPVIFDTERYPDLEPLRFVTTAEKAYAVFGLEAESAAYSRLARMIKEGRRPPPNAVRIEEILNAFDYAWPKPEAEGLKITTAIMNSPWNEEAKLLRVAAAAPSAPANRPPLNLVVLIDTSGSMAQTDKLPLVKTALRGLAKRLERRDRIAIVDYANNARITLAPTAGDDRDVVIGAIESLSSGGGTNGEGGLRQAYALIDRHRRDDSLNQIVVFSDGDFNIGLSEQSVVRALIEEKRDANVFLNIVGVGTGDLNDQVMQAIAQTGNGVATYAGDLADARRVIDDLIAGRTAPAAADVKLEIEMNPAVVGAWRLLGYETRPQTRRTFEDDTKDSGEIWLGRSAVALIEYVPPGHDLSGGRPPRYAAPRPDGAPDEIAFLRARYKTPGEAESQLFEQAVVETAPTVDDRFAAAAGFGMILRGADQIASFDFDAVAKLAEQALGEDADGRRRDFVDLARVAALVELP